jgi:hypothetical protein
MAVLYIQSMMKLMKSPSFFNKVPAAIAAAKSKKSTTINRVEMKKSSSLTIAVLKGISCLNELSNSIDSSQTCNCTIPVLAP